MRFALIAALKDLRRRAADPAALLLWIGLPVVIGGLMSLIGGGDGPAPKARLLLVDHDQTLLSGLVARAGQQGALAELLDIQSVTANVGRQHMDDGEASAMLVIPKGFQDGVLRERPTELTLVTNPAQRILPGIIEEGLRMAVEAAFYAQRLFGPPIRDIADAVQLGTGPPDEMVASVSRAINQRIRSLGTTLLPPVVTLETRTETTATVRPNFGALFLPGLLVMALLFTAQGMSIDIWTEKLRGTLRRTLSAPLGAGAFLAGKLGAGVVLMALATIVGLAVGMTMFDVPVARVPLALVWTSFAGTAILCYLVALQLVSTSARGGQLLSTLVTFPLIMIGGSFFPFETMPAWMARIGRWTPNGLAVVHVKAILFGRVDPAGLTLAAIAIGLPAILAFLLSVRRLRGAFATN
jgi:ABC-type multidrug transport system permease subunit